MEDQTVITQFTPDDLFAAVMIIDHACNQGAFKGWENIEKAYAVRERLVKFAEQWKSVTPSTEGDTTNETN